MTRRTCSILSIAPKCGPPREAVRELVAQFKRIVVEQEELKRLAARRAREWRPDCLDPRISDVEACPDRLAVETEAVGDAHVTGYEAHPSP